jgi:hypothetical protein
MKEKWEAFNSTCSKGGVSFSVDTFVQAESSVHQTKFGVKNPALRVAAKRPLPAVVTTIAKRQIFDHSHSSPA